MIKFQNSLYRGHRFPAEVIAHAVWLYFRFPLSLRVVEYLLAARGIIVSHETVRRWAEKFGRDFANKVRRRGPQLGDAWRLDEAAAAAARANPGLARCVFAYNEAVSHLMQAGADFIPAPSHFEPRGLTQLYALRHGATPIAARVGGLADAVIDASEAALGAGVSWRGPPNASPRVQGDRVGCRLLSMDRPARHF